MGEPKPFRQQPQYQKLDLLGHHCNVTREVWADLTTLCGMEETLAKLDPEKDQWLYELGKERCDVKFSEIREKLQSQPEYHFREGDCWKCSSETNKMCLQDSENGRPAICHIPH